MTLSKPFKKENHTAALLAKSDVPSRLRAAIRLYPS
jgi:hypothetical protein